MIIKRVIKKVRGLMLSMQTPDMNMHPMKGINSYWRQLTAGEVERGEHRNFVGGLWEKKGKLQFDFMRENELLPHHKLVDIGCGALRGGVHFIRYLNRGNYYGIDINASLIKAGKREVESEDLLDKHPHLLVNNNFEMSRFDVSFDFAIAVSLFTHLYANQIVRCLVEIRKVLKPDGKFYATFFEAPSSAHLEPITQHPGGITTYFDADPFHYSVPEMEWVAKEACLLMNVIGDWEHPRAQKMLCFFQ